MLIPTYQRAAALSVNLTSLCAQTYRDFRVVISDQTEDYDVVTVGEVQAVVRVLEAQQHSVIFHKHLPRRGMAEQRQFLLDQATAPYVLSLDDDLILEPDMIERLLKTMQREGCAFVGCAPIGLSFRDDIRPHEQHITFWDGPVQPEIVRPRTAEWNRFSLHNAANIYHVQQRLNLTAQNQRTYRVAWVGGCILYNTARLRSVGGYTFWQELPPDHSGEDVVVQVRLMETYGGCGLIPSGVYHQELPTTVAHCHIDAPNVLDLSSPVVQQHKQGV